MGNRNGAWLTAIKSGAAYAMYSGARGSFDSFPAKCVGSGYGLLNKTPCRSQRQKQGQGLAGQGGEAVVLVEGGG